MRVMIVHFRSALRDGLQEEAQHRKVSPSDSAGTDGVSLEMKKRAALLEAMGHEVAICSAYNWADFPINALEFDHEEVIRMIRNLFGPGIEDFRTEAQLKEVFDASVLELKRDLTTAVKGFGANMLFVHNVLCLPIHPVATVSLTQLLRETSIPCAAIHHDILSEGAYKFTPTCNFARSLLEGYYPPTMDNVRHWTINTRNQRALGAKGVKAEVIHDSMDFGETLDPAERLRIREDLRSKYGVKPYDILLFVGARIVPNKQTELAGHLAATLRGLRPEMIGKRLYHGEVISQKSRVILVLAGRPERGFMDYKKKLFELFDRLKIDWMYVGADVRPQRSETEGQYALYPDMYAVADFVLYPTGWEGFGNQLLEAFAAGLPVAVFEYPVFKEDIATKGVKCVSLGDTLLEERDSSGLVQLPPEVLNQAAREVMTILTSPERFGEITKHNVAVGERCFSFDVLQAHLLEATTWASRLSC